MTVYTQWKDLMENQTDETFEAFWKEYSETETRIYTAILKRPAQPLAGTFKELVDRFEADPVLFMGFLDGIQTSLVDAFPIDNIDDASPISILVNPEALYLNMLIADAEYLYTLPQWDDVLTDVKRAAITKVYKKTKIVVNNNKTGRNDPCPCGSGKKYKHCCGKN
jgi:SEC-C motif